MTIEQIQEVMQDTNAPLKVLTQSGYWWCTYANTTGGNSQWFLNMEHNGQRMEIPLETVIRIEPNEYL